MKLVSQLLAALLVALLIHPVPLAAGDSSSLEVSCACCGDVPCEGCECITETDKDVPVPFSAEAAGSVSLQMIPLLEGVAISVPKWRQEPGAARSGSKPALSDGRYCGRSCVLRL